MRKDELEAGLAKLSARMEPLEKFLHIFAKTLPAPLYYHSGLQYFGFRYGKPDFRHFCLLKGIRAVSALNASIVLVRTGFTQELHVLLRTVVEFKSHIEYVLSERDAAGNLSKEVEAHIEKYFADYQRNSPADYKRPSLRQGQVHESVGRMYAGGIKNPDHEQNFAGVVPAKLFSNIYLNFSNYVHGRYPEAMDLYGGDPLGFHLRGMSGTSKDEENYLMLEVSIESVSMMLRMLIRRLALSDILKGDASLQVWFHDDSSTSEPLSTG